jgi:hypothetical protein
MADVAILAPAEEPAAADQSRGSRRRVPYRGWGGGAFLVAGLALVALIVAKTKGIDPGALDQIHADGTMTHEPLGQYSGGWSDPTHNPFADNRLRLLTPFLALIYLTSVGAIGAVLLRSVRGIDGWPRLVRLLAGFLPGFLIVLLPLQLLFAGIGTFTASWIALVAVPLAAVLLQRRTIVTTAGRLRRNEHHDRRTALGVTAAAALILLICGLWRIQAGRYFMAPDSIGAFLQAADGQLAGALGGHLALWDQQSDEWVFNAPLLFTSHAGHDQLFTFWATQFVALASFAALVFGVVFSFAWRHRVLAGLLAVGLILASTPSIYPWDNAVIIGGQNPALWLAHPGRQISIVAPWIALLLIGRHSRAGVIAILLASAGLAFTTVEGAVYTVGALLCAGVWTLLSGRWRMRSPSPRARLAGVVTIHALVIAALASPLYVYYALHHTDYQDPLAWFLVVGAGLALLAAVLLALTSRPVAAGPGGRSWRGPAALGAGVVGALVAGLFLSNNLVSDVAGGGVRRVLGDILPGYHGTVLSRSVLDTGSLTFPSFGGTECGLSGHCISFTYFLVTYGFTLVVAFAGWLALGRIDDDARTNRLRAAWLVIVAGLVIGLALLDFTGAPDLLTAWILTRFVEVPYYAVLAFAAVVFTGARNRLTLGAGVAVLALWTIIPFAGDHVVQQVVKNGDWLIGTLH